MNLTRKSVDMHKKHFLTLFFIILFMWSLFSVSWSRELFHSGGKDILLDVSRSLFRPDMSFETVSLALFSSWITIAYAFSGMSIAIAIAFLTGILASGVLVSKDSSLAKILSMSFFRGLLGFMRAVHELVWAWLFVAAIGLSPYAAIFALAIPYGGSLGRIFADILNDVPQKPINALKSSGASNIQLLMYGYLPLSAADMLSYTMYRLECSVRSSTIMSFVGLGGLGYQIQLALADLRFERVWTFMLFLIIIVTLIDFWSNAIRERLSV